MQCPACGHENRDAARFCGACAAALVSEVACAACGTSNPVGQRFCDACAQPLAGSGGPPRVRPTPASYTPKHLAERILTSRSAIEGERKHVTVLFADIVDSMPLTEKSGPEEMHALMDRCFQAILPEIHRYEGTINQFQGDGFMALFGAPLALEDAPRRACLAALAVLRALEPVRRELRERHGVDLQWRIGIHSGPVVVGRIGDDLRMDYTAVGDTTNLAARLEKAASPDGILISDTTRRLVSGYFELEDGGEVEVKGKSEPVRVFEVLAELEVSGRIEAATAVAGLTPLCGREGELGALRAAFESASEGHGKVVFVVGEAGIGKSRLLHEFHRQLADVPHVWFLGLCIDFGRAALQPVVDGLRRFVGIEDRDDDATALARVDRAIRALDADLDWTLPFLRHLLSLPVGDEAVEAMNGMTRRSETVKALNSIVMSAAAERPVVFVVEDLHWIDATSEEFLAGLADSVPASRVMLVLTWRPGYAHPFGDRSYHTRIAMQALSEGETREMASALLESAELPAELQRLISSKAEGNPLFVEEVTKSLLEEGVLELDEGRVRLVRALAEVAIPDTLQDVLMARIDRLEDEPKRAIQMASVIGREFALRLLQRLIEVGEPVQEVVAELRSLELIYEKAAHPELAFMFKHALTQEVAYQSVLVQRRKALHGVVGAAIEELYRDRLPEHYEKLAHHFELAEDWRKALDYHRLAARKAARTFANRAAAEHWRRALEIAPRLSHPEPEEAMVALNVQLGFAAATISAFGVAQDAFIRAAEIASDPATQARNLARAGYAGMWAHEYDKGREVTAAALSLARTHDLAAEHAMALVNEDAFGLVLGEVFDTALSDEAVRVAEESGDPEALVLAHSFHAGRLERAGDYRGAIANCERALSVGRGTVLEPLVAFATWFLGLSQACLGQYGRAVADMQAALGICERVGDQAVRARVLNTLGWCFAEFNCHRRASEYNERSAALGREMVEQGLVPLAPELYANGSVNLTGNRIMLGDLDGARRALEPIEEQMSRSSDPWMRWRYSLHVLHAQARIALVSGDVDRVFALTKEELSGARSSHSKKLVARALELRGRALVVADQRDEAHTTLEAALELAGAIEYPPVVWRAHSLLAELARRSGDRATADHHGAQARQLVERLCRSLPDPDLRREFSSLGERLATDPLGAYR